MGLSFVEISRFFKFSRVLGFLEPARPSGPQDPELSLAAVRVESGIVSEEAE